MILITGLTGTSGSAFYEVLCREKCSEKIKVIVRKTTDISMFSNSELDIELLYGDINDTKFLIQSMKDCDKVFHIANKGLSTPIVEAMIQSPQVKYAIMVSSTIVYSKYYSDLHLKEDEEMYIQKFEQAGIKHVFIRPTMIFGTVNDRNISVFIRWFKKYPIFPIVKNGVATIRPVSRLDLAEAYWLIYKNIENLKRKEYVVSGKEEMTLIQMFHMICDLLERKVVFFNIPFSVAKFLVNGVYYCTFKKIDYREKLDRLGENRAYDHDDLKNELKYEPLSFEERLKPLIKEINKL